MDLKTQILEMSKRDVIPAAPQCINDPSKIPEELVELLKHHVKSYEGITPTGEQYLHIITGLSNLPEVPKDMYWFVWKLMIYLEHYQNVVASKQYSQTNQKLRLSDYRPNEILISVPGLSENRPSVRVKDKIDIYQVDGLNIIQSVVRFVGRDYVSVAVPSSFINKLNGTQRYNVEFNFCDWLINALNNTLNELQQYNLSPILFPEGMAQPQVLDTEKLSWLNKDIEKNPEQQQAVRNILKKSSHPAPYILFGPPGTGKTSTLVETICQIMEKQPNTRILICTPSNAAADEIVIRLLRNFISEKALYRMYSSSRNSDDIHADIKPFSNCMDTEFVYLSYEVFQTKKIVVTTLATCVRLHKYRLRDNHFEYLFVDEAGQATEVETLIPFLLMASKNPVYNGKWLGQIVLAGDPMQLGPIVQSTLARPLLGRSMLERLINSSVGPYKKNSSGQYNEIYITKLVLNYRCHASILYLPNKLFYDGELKAIGGKHTEQAHNWEKLPNKNFPIIFHAVNSHEERKPHSPSFYNREEISVALKYVQSILKSKFNGKTLAANDIAVITPYKLQKVELCGALKQAGLKDVPVGTVELFQGQERDVIIISTVRSVMYRVNGDRFHIGHLSNPKRFNVAITRARALLIVIGNPQVLQHDEYWRTFIQYCLDNNACTGAAFKIETRVNHNLIAKNTKPWKPVSKDTITEDPDCGYADDYAESAVDYSRRRRLPMGPLLEAVPVEAPRKVSETFCFDEDAPPELFTTASIFSDDRDWFWDDDDSYESDEGFHVSASPESYSSNDSVGTANSSPNVMNKKLLDLMKTLNLCD